MKKTTYKSFYVGYYFFNLFHFMFVEKFSATILESFIVNFSLKIVKFDISTCAFKWGIRVWFKQYIRYLDVIYGENTTDFDFLS